MPNVITAISLRESLFNQVKELAHDLDVPRSRIFVLALENFIHHHENRNLLDAKEAHLPKRSVVVVSQVFTIDETQLGEQIGILSRRRVRQILYGIKLLTELRVAE